MTVSASNIKKGTQLAHISMPIGPHCFVPERMLITKLMEDLEKPISSSSSSSSSVFDQMYHFLTPVSYTMPMNSEKDFCSPNLNIIFHQIRDSMKENLRDNIKLKQEVSSDLSIKLVFSSSRSQGEMALMYRALDKHLCLIASEAKGVDASLSACYPQAVCMACDFAVDQCQNFQISWENVVVPFIITSSDSVQFGAVYLVDPCYPCPVLLSEELKMTNQTGLLSIIKWIGALACFCENTIALLEPQPKRGSMDVAKPVQLNLDRYFLKPVRDMKQESMRIWLGSLMSLFKILRDHEDCRQFVVFPDGIIGNPDDKSQAELAIAVRARINEQFRLYKNQAEGEYHNQFAIIGSPIILYPLYDMTEWKRGDSLIDSTDLAVREKFMEQLRRATDAFNRAGIIHVDLRLFNILYKVVDNNKEERGTFDLELKVLDWDDCVSCGWPLPECLREERKGYTGSNPLKKMYPLETDLVTTAYHEFFLRQIADDLHLSTT